MNNYLTLTIFLVTLMTFVSGDHQGTPNHCTAIADVDKLLIDGKKYSCPAVAPRPAWDRLSIKVRGWIERKEGLGRRGGRGTFVAPYDPEAPPPAPPSRRRRRAAEDPIISRSRRDVYGRAAAPAKKNDKKEKEDAVTLKKRKYKRANILKKGMAINNPFTLYAWDTRVFHAMFMSILTLFFAPVSLFITRYYKETFMKHRVYVLRFWYFIHLIATIFILSLFCIGLFRQWESAQLVGKNYNTVARLHRGVGWASFVIYLLMVLFGGVRPMQAIARKIIIGAHCFLGYFIYYALLICTLVSYRIPGSPGAFKDVTVVEYTKAQIKDEPVPLIVTLWFFMEVIIHIIMHVLLWKADAMMKLTRRRCYFPTPLPVLLENERYDIPYFKYRQIILAVYMFIAFLNTVMVCCFVHNYSPRGRGLGWTTCTYYKNGTDEKTKEPIYKPRNFYGCQPEKDTADKVK